MKDGRPCRFSCLIISPVKWHLKNSHQQQSRTNKNKDIFFLSCCAHASLYMCCRSEECRLMDEGTGMFFFIPSHALGYRRDERPSHTINFVLLERRWMRFVLRVLCVEKKKKGKKIESKQKRYRQPRRKKTRVLALLYRNYRQSFCGLC